MRFKSYRPSLERLEERQLLAGNVHVALSAGKLIITGDEAANRISVESAGRNKVVVRGFDTEVNGVQNGGRVFNFASGDMEMHLQGGDDLVRITNLIAPGKVLVSLGKGNDEVVTGRDKSGGDARFAGNASGPLYVRGDLSLYGGEGHDLAYQSDAHISGSGLINLGSGDDTLFMQRPAERGSNVDYAGLSVLPAAGNDVIDLLGLVVDGDLAIRDSGGPLYLHLRDADVHHNFQITSAAFADTIDVSATHITGQLTIDSRAGDDRVRISAIANQLNIDLGDGNDGCELTSSNIKTSHVDGGLGDDVFFARYAYGVDAYFSGGAGRDILRTSRSLPNQLTRLQTESIEVTQALV